MARLRIFSVHRTWEDRLGIAIGLLIVISPWLAHGVDFQLVVINAVIVGMLVISLAGMEIVVLRASEEWLELASGLWLMASPFVLGYASSGEPPVLAFCPGCPRRAACDGRALARLEHFGRIGGRVTRRLLGAGLRVRLSKNGSAQVRKALPNKALPNKPLPNSVLCSHFPARRRDGWSNAIGLGVQRRSGVFPNSQGATDHV